MVRRNRCHGKVEVRSKVGLGHRMAAGAAAVALLGGLGTASLALAAPAGASVNVFVPCSGPGGGPVGLSNAVKAANAVGGGTIQLASSCTYSYTTANNATDGGNALPIIATPITISGGSATTVARSSSARGDFRIFDVGSTGTLTLRFLTLTGGKADGGGGILANAGKANLSAVTLTGNTAKEGGGLLADNGGNASLANSLVSHNDANGSGLRGGGGIEVATTSTLHLTNTRVVNNTAAFFAGGIRIIEHGAAVIQSSAIDDNTSDGNVGGIDNGSFAVPGDHTTLRLTSSEVKRNRAFDVGGIDNGAFSTATVGSTVVDNNKATGPSGIVQAAGIENDGTMHLVSGDVGYNTATVTRGGTGEDEALGAGIFNGPAATVGVSSTNVHNNIAQTPLTSGTAEGGGIYNSAGTAHVPKAGAVNLSSSIIMDNTVTGKTAHGGGIFNRGAVTNSSSLVVRNHPNNCYPTGSVPGCSG